MIQLCEFDGFRYMDGGVCAAKGFRANGIHCGIAKKALAAHGENNDTAVEPAKKKNDLALIVADNMCNCAAVYTTNKVKGAPIAVTRENIKNGKAKAVIVNSVNANTCNADGE